MEKMIPAMINNILSQNHIKRSKKREDYEVTKVKKLKMVAMGINVIFETSAQYRKDGRRSKI